MILLESNAFQVKALAEASQTFGTLNNVIEFDVQNDTVGQLRSRSRHLRRVRQGLDLIKTLFQNFLSSQYVRFVFCIQNESLVLHGLMHKMKLCLDNWVMLLFKI